MLNQRIKTFYDSSSALWEQVWGEHMHHGFYEQGEASYKDRRQAQIDLIEELLNWSRVENLEVNTQILDIGCGIGGSSLYLAEKFPSSQVTGITLSPVQANRAKARAKEFGLESRTDFQVADALSMPFASNSFDLIWSLESGEHMPDKSKFLAECLRVLKPNGKLIFATWCHRETQAKPLTINEKQHLQRIYDVYCLPYVISVSEYEAIALELGFKNICTVDWSEQVSPFWDRVIESALSLRNILGVIQAGLPTIIATTSLRLMARGYSRGLVKFGVLTAQKI
ncbi:methyltransferase family protein [Synechococcus sp. PCC 7502]|uniref:methyltransferase domain-containing protein n=1 Tax=Synechococcus sp. PCC 7502 TaxID=1173263 RepID=UPI00029FF66D|nr:methyltransferase domain-containing protein [Synechococcus sp. PCC 7502]AFY74183.1 methyltransferase family protein [Synechococcus sp. PCC 7502]